MRFDILSFSLLLLLALVWGGSFFFAEIALSELPPLTIACLRVCFALPALMAVVWIKGHHLPKRPKTWFSFAVMGAFNNAIPFSLIFWGQQWLSSGVASILNGTTAIFGVIVAALFFKDEKLTRGRIAGSALGLIGVSVIMGFDSLAHMNMQNLGQIAVLLAALSYAIASSWGRLRLSDQPPLVNALGMVATSAAILLPASIWVDGFPLHNISGEVWWALLGLSLLSTAFAYVLYFAILARAGAANLMLVTLLIPPVATVLGTVFLNETLTRDQLFGFAIIGLGLLVNDGRIFNGKQTR